MTNYRVWFQCSCGAKRRMDGTSGDSPLTSDEAGEIADLGLGPSWHCDGRITWELWSEGVRQFTGWLVRPTSRFPVREDE